jgi:hypothetical protein
MTEYARSEPEQPETIPPWPPDPEPAPNAASEPALQYLPRRIIPPGAPHLEPALEATPEPAPHYLPRRGFGIGSLTGIVLGVAVVVITSIVWFKPFAASSAPKPQSYEIPAAPAAQ